MNGRARQAVLLAACVSLPLVAGALSAVFTNSAVNSWYAGLAKPWFNPPDQVFMPAWTVLYILMGFSLYLVLRGSPAARNRNPAAVLFAVQLCLNVLWPFLFFGLRLPGIALAEITVMLVFIALTIACFMRISRTAALLLVPYFCWTCFALVLNAAIVILN